MLMIMMIWEPGGSGSQASGSKPRYQTFIVPVLMYGCETWANTKYLCSRLDAFDTWALRKILRIPYARHVSNAEVRRTTGCLLQQSYERKNCRKILNIFIWNL